MSSLQCSTCNAPLKFNAKFCTKCGAIAPIPKSPSLEIPSTPQQDLGPVSLQAPLSPSDDSSQFEEKKEPRFLKGPAWIKIGVVLLTLIVLSFLTSSYWKIFIPSYKRGLTSECWNKGGSGINSAWSNFFMNRSYEIDEIIRTQKSIPTHLALSEVSYLEKATFQGKTNLDLLVSGQVDLKYPDLPIYHIQVHLLCKTSFNSSAGFMHGWDINSVHFLNSNSPLPGMTPSTVENPGVNLMEPQNYPDPAQ